MHDTRVAYGTVLYCMQTLRGLFVQQGYWCSLLYRQTPCLRRYPFDWGQITAASGNTCDQKREVPIRAVRRPRHSKGSVSFDTTGLSPREIVGVRGQFENTSKRDR